MKTHGSFFKDEESTRTDTSRSEAVVPAVKPGSRGRGTVRRQVFRARCAGGTRKLRASDMGGSAKIEFDNLIENQKNIHTIISASSADDGCNFRRSPGSSRHLRRLCSYKEAE